MVTTGSIDGPRNDVDSSIDDCIYTTNCGLTKRVDEDCADGPLEGPQSYQPHNCNYYPGN